MVKHSRVIDHAALEKLEGLLTVEGVKYTTAPSIALQVEKILVRKNIIGPTGKRTKSPQRQFADTSGENNRFSMYRNRFPHIPLAYGNADNDVFNIVATEGGAGNFIMERQPLIKAEVIYCIREEMAVKLSDMILRRTDCGSFGCPSPQELGQIAEIMAGELGWSMEQIDKEIDLVISHYRNRLSIQL
jgi:glycerol-3-phosphate dehydrogenase